MNSKIFTLTALFLFFILKINAQDIYAYGDNSVTVKLSVTDDMLAQKFQLVTQAQHFVTPDTNIVYKIHLDYQSDKDQTSYFGIQLKELKSRSSEQSEPHVPGITAPVLIPPVRKKKAFRANKPEKFPFSIHGRNIAENVTYEVEMTLVKFLSKSDYDNQTNSYSAVSTVIFRVSASLNPATPFSVSAYPNPSTDHINFEYTYASNQNTALAVTIFDDEGVQMHQYNLSSSGTTANSISYILDTSHLQDGTYYFQLLHNGTTEVKTVIIQ